MEFSLARLRESTQCPHNPSAARLSTSQVYSYYKSTLQYPHNPRDYRDMRYFPAFGIWSRSSATESGVDRASQCLWEKAQQTRHLLEGSNSGIYLYHQEKAYMVYPASLSTDGEAYTLPVSINAQAQTQAEHCASASYTDDFPQALSLSSADLDESALEKCTLLEGEISGLKQGISQNKSDIEVIKQRISQLSKSKDNDKEGEARRVKQLIAALNQNISFFCGCNEQYQRHLVQLVEVREIRAVMNGSQQLKDRVRLIKRSMQELDGGVQRLRAALEMVRAFY